MLIIDHFLLKNEKEMSKFRKKFICFQNQDINYQQHFIPHSATFFFGEIFAKLIFFYKNIYRLSISDTLMSEYKYFQQLAVGIYLFPIGNINLNAKKD